MLDAELRVLHWLAEHERDHPGKPVKDADLVQALELGYATVHSIVNGLKAKGEVEARDFHTAGLGYEVFAIKLTLSGLYRLAEIAKRATEPF
jgi:DNA-binding IclR family transcriptional regulator